MSRCVAFSQHVCGSRCSPTWHKPARMVRCLSVVSETSMTTGAGGGSRCGTPMDTLYEDDEDYGCDD